MIAARDLLPLASVLALACIPTVVHSYMGRTVDDRRSAAAVPTRLNGLEGRPSGRSAAWVLETFGATDFIERQYGSLTLFVARSYDAKRLYHHPELAVAYGDPYDRAVVVRRPERPDVPIFVLESGPERRSVYALLYEDQFIERPMHFQLRNALSLLVRPRAMMTLFFVRQKSGAARADSAETLLLAAIDSFVAKAAPSSP
jgi:hypothetical protein